MALCAFGRTITECVDDVSACTRALSRPFANHNNPSLNENMNLNLAITVMNRPSELITGIRRSASEAASTYKIRTWN